jgi:hypothetical protein
MKKSAILLSALFLIASVASGAMAAGQKNGFGSETDSSSGQGNPDNTNVQNNEGTTTTTTTVEGPKGQLKQDNNDCNNCTTTTTVDLPGKNR